MHHVQLAFSVQGFADALALCRKGKHEDISQMSRTAYAFYEWYLQATGRNAEIIARKPDGSAERIRLAPAMPADQAMEETEPSDHIVMLKLDEEGFERMEALRSNGKHLDRGHMSKAAYVLYGWYLDEIEKGNEIVVREPDGSTARITFSAAMA